MDSDIIRMSVKLLKIVEIFTLSNRTLAEVLITFNEK